MKHILLILLFTPLLFAKSRIPNPIPGEVIFQDDFERNESQEKTEEIGNNWQTNSESRAKGNKQVDLKDGTMHITCHPEANHGVSVNQPAEFTDGSVTMRIKLPDKASSIGINFADPKCKDVQGSHICECTIYQDRLVITDLKTGRMKWENYRAIRAKNVSRELKKLLEDKTKTFTKRKLKKGRWHDLHIQITGETMTVWIDKEKAGEFTSEGIGHATKKNLRLSVPKQAIVDDIVIRKVK